MSIRVLVVDDQEALRTAFRTLIDAEPDMSVVGEAADGARAVQVASRLAPDVVVMDIRMPVMDGIAATRTIRDAGAGAPAVLILSTFDPDEYVFGALRAGAGGFVLKSRPLDDLLEAIRVLAAGESLLAPSITRRLIERYAALPEPGGGPDPAFAELTERELQVLGRIAAGRSNGEIATDLDVGVATVKTHVNRIFAKLGLRDRAQLVIAAYEHGLVHPG